MDQWSAPIWKAYCGDGSSHKTSVNDSKNVCVGRGGLATFVQEQSYEQYLAGEAPYYPSLSDLPPDPILTYYDDPPATTGRGGGGTKPPEYVPPVYVEPVEDIAPVYDPPVYTPPVYSTPPNGIVPEDCPPGYGLHVSGQCVPLGPGTQNANDVPQTVTPGGGGSAVIPQDGPPSANPLAALYDANGKIFGFEPMYVFIAAGALAFLLLKK